MFYVHMLYKDGDKQFQEFNNVVCQQFALDQDYTIRINGISFYGYTPGTSMRRPDDIRKSKSEAEKDYSEILKNISICINNPTEYFLEVDFFHHTTAAKPITELN